MLSWNVIWVRAKEYVLLNSDSTPVKLSPSSKPDISWLMSRMEELNVPIAYTKDLEEIYFTKLPGGVHGDYCAGRIRLAADVKTCEIMDKVFVHELAHHVDDQEDVVSDERLIKEKKLKAKYMADTYAKRSIGEYLAVGFEVYYVGTKKEKSVMKKKNPRLYKIISDLHRKFSRH